VKGRAFLAVLPALAGFFGTCWLVGALLDRRVDLRLLAGSIEEQKFRHFRTHADEYDLVFVGTSRVHRGFDPGVFDGRMADLGRPVHSYNFGLVGLGFLEELYVVEWILAQEPERLRWILLDPIHLDTVLQRGNLFNLRDVNWHTPGLALRGIRAALTSSRGLADELELVRLHLLHAGQRFCNVGVSSNLLRRLWSDGDVAPVAEDGFGGTDARSRSDQEREARAPEEEPVRPSRLLWLTLRECWQRSRAAGLQAFFVLPPTRKLLAAFRRAHANGALPALLSYSQEELPEVFARPESTFYSEGHLNRLGATRFSQRLAADLFPLLASR
jgi:hypothetical protein